MASRADVVLDRVRRFSARCLLMTTIAFMPLRTAARMIRVANTVVNVALVMVNLGG